ncbi:MAG: DUF2497 domain-containing protein [Alphaproteobacteria bacterium]|nr:DUF2497 domain-containing protein [Alphaproteobacteria bacterium]
MEEILASIRKIISDEEPPAEAAAPAVAPVAEPAPAVEPTPIPPGEEIIELTQMVQNDGSVVDLAAPAPVAPAPAPAPEPEMVSPPPPAPVRAAPPQPVPPAAPLVSDPVAATAAGALSSLASTVEIDRLSHAPSGATYIGNGGRTLEDMTMELMRPLLKGWLDQNLPQIVERLVQKEIERISKRS